jgi:hypothetical protein
VGKGSPGKTLHCKNSKNAAKIQLGKIFFLFLLHQLNYLTLITSKPVFQGSFLLHFV